MKKADRNSEMAVLIQQNKSIMKQNETMISLLGRLAFTQKEIREIVEKNKAEDLKQKYVNGYNALDGSKTTKELTTIIGVTQGTLSPILTQWLEKGIIFEVDKTVGAAKFYKHLFLLLGDSSDK